MRTGPVYEEFDPGKEIFGRHVNQAADRRSYLWFCFRFGNCCCFHSGYEKFDFEYAGNLELENFGSSDLYASKESYSEELVNE